MIRGVSRRIVSIRLGGIPVAGVRLGLEQYWTGYVLEGEEERNQFVASRPGSSRNDWVRAADSRCRGDGRFRTKLPVAVRYEPLLALLHGRKPDERCSSTGTIPGYQAGRVWAQLGRSDRWRPIHASGRMPWWLTDRPVGASGSESSDTAITNDRFECAPSGSSRKGRERTTTFNCCLTHGFSCIKWTP